MLAYLFLKCLQIVLCKKSQKLSAIITEQQEHAITYFVIENEDKLQCILACGKTVTFDMNALLKMHFLQLKEKVAEIKKVLVAVEKRL